MLRKNVSDEQERGCGRRSGRRKPGEVPEEVVGVYVLVPLRVWVYVPLLMGGKREPVDTVVPRAGRDMSEDVVVIGPEDDIA